MSRYVDPSTKTEAIVGFHCPTGKIPKSWIALDDDHPFFSPLPAGKRFTWENNSAPTLEDEPPYGDSELSKDEALSIVQQHIDTEAHLRGYDNIVSACSYAGYDNEFQAEAIQLGKWRSACWSACYAYLSGVKDGTKTMPLRNEIPALLPKVEDYA